MADLFRCLIVPFAKCLTGGHVTTKNKYNTDIKFNMEIQYLVPVISVITGVTNVITNMNLILNRVCAVKFSNETLLSDVYGFNRGLLVRNLGLK